MQKSGLKRAPAPPATGPCRGPGMLPSPQAHQQKNVINSIMSILPDNRPITSLQIVEDSDKWVALLIVCRLVFCFYLVPFAASLSFILAYQEYLNKECPFYGCTLASASLGFDCGFLEYLCGGRYEKTWAVCWRLKISKWKYLISALITKVEVCPLASTEFQSNRSIILLNNWES